MKFGPSDFDLTTVQFSQDLMRVPGYNPLLNRIAMWGLVLVPISKFALATRPVSPAQCFDLSRRLSLSSS